MPLIVAGERSGVGKTTVTLALLSYLSQQGLRVQSFKVGPDYIDPMFHRFVTGRACRNLDPVLTSEAYVQQSFVHHSQTATHALVEGVMGLFDGAAGRADYASTAHVARLLQCPVLLVLDCSRLSHSIAALVQGYRCFDPRIQLVGVVLNRVGSDRHLELLKSALAPLQVPILGVLHRQDQITIPDRHLGLIPTAELTDLNRVIDRLAHLGAQCFDWSRLMPLLQVNPSMTPPGEFLAQNSGLKARIAIAQDPAFNFYYPDNLELLEQLGAELLPWSPLSDPVLPPGTQGLYLGGGFPEMFAAQLASNQAARTAVRTAIQSGLPTYAECGGLMYLCQQVVDFDEQAHSMVGVLPTTAVMGQRLTLGYRQITALQPGPLLEQGAIAWGHEFHRSHLLQPAPNPLLSLLPTGSTQPTLEGWGLPTLHASYVHLHWGARPDIPLRFLRHCHTFQPL